MYVVEKYAWMSTDDLNITRIIDLLITNSFRAHKDGVFEYQNGSWDYIEEFKYTTIRNLLPLLGYAAKVLKVCADEKTDRALEPVFNLVRLKYDDIQPHNTICFNDSEVKLWDGQTRVDLWCSSSWVSTH